MTDTLPLDIVSEDPLEDEALDRTEGGKLTATAGICFCKP